jgi:PilZ domain
MDYSLAHAVWPLMVVAIATSHRLIRSKSQAAIAQSPGTKAKTYATERRKSRRRDGNGTPIYVAFPDAKAERMAGVVADHSRGGLGIFCRHEFETGTILIVCPLQSVGLTPWCQVEVVACRKTKSGWRLSCRFVAPHPNTVSMLFGL